jgi:hypothetical protein
MTWNLGSVMVLGGYDSGKVDEIGVKFGVLGVNCEDSTRSVGHFT